MSVSDKSASMPTTNLLDLIIVAKLNASQPTVRVNRKRIRNGAKRS